MGTWHLEVVRMVFYIAFPVGIFHWFNQPENFTEFVETNRREMGMIPDMKLKAVYDEFVESVNKEKDSEKLKKMEAEYMN